MNQESNRRDAETQRSLQTATDIFSAPLRLCGEPFFNTPERIAQLRAEAQSWLGTPFRDGIGPRAKRGTACDCVSFVACVLQSCGAIGRVPWPRRYVSCTGGPGMLETLLNVLGKIERLSCLYSAPLRLCGEFVPGDVLVGSTGRARHHIALYMGNNQLLHCWSGSVQEGNAKDTLFVRHLHSVWRAFEFPDAWHPAPDTNS